MPCTNVTKDDLLYTGLPVEGYRTQTATAVEVVNENKRVEERLLRRLEALLSDTALHADGRFVSIARTHFEQGFMALNRAVFKPVRIALPEDAKGT